MTTSARDSRHVEDPLDPDPARGPHLPDRWPVLVFVLLAAATAWLSYQKAATTAWTPELAFSFALGLLPPVCSALLPAALLLRHPDAGRRARILLFGTLLFAAVPFLALIEDSLQETFTTLTPVPDDLGYAPLALAYNAFQTAIATLGVVCLALGLSRTRHWAFTRRASRAGLVILVTAAITAILYLYSQSDLGDTVMTPAIWVWRGSSVVLGVFVILGWAYLAVTLTRCAVAGEEPTAGWSVAATGACLVVAMFAISVWSAVVQTPNETLASVVFWLTSVMYSLGFLGLLAGFALGLPSLAPVDWADEADGATTRRIPDDVTPEPAL